MDNAPRQDNGKTVAIISYITLFGWIFALIMHNGNKTSLGAYHLRQTLGLMILAVAIYIFSYVLYLVPFGAFVVAALNIGVFVFWIIGLVSAINGDEKPLPVVGDMFQKWFAGFAL